MTHRPEAAPGDAADLPTISVVTASLNRVAFLEEAMRSVLDQNYPKLQYAVVDGGSTDGSVEIIRKYADRLAWWCSEKDAGHFDALNKGFARTDGEVMAFINSDDKYCPWAFAVVAEIFRQLPQVDWITTRHPIIWDRHGRAVLCKDTPGFSRRGFLRGEYLPGQPDAYASHWIQQESTFWRRSLWEKAGGNVDDSLRVAGDFELWARFFEHADLYAVATPLAGFRIHGDQFTGTQFDRYMKICLDILHRHGGRPHGKIASAARRSRLVRRVPNKWKAAMGLHNPGRQIYFDVGAQRWTIRDIL
jgi:glycosyltransferase involved in cell wall biosynthesis